MSAKDLIAATIKEWANIAVAVAAIAALAVSVVSLLFSWRALKLSEKQEQRKEPRLIPHLLDSYYEKTAEGGRMYGFLISVRNPSDADNAISQIEMHVRITVKGATPMTLKLSALEKEGVMTASQVMRPPCRIAAHDTLKGWCHFLISPNLLGESVIEEYSVVISDSHQADTRLELSVVSERRDVS